MSRGQVGEEKVPVREPRRESVREPYTVAIQAMTQKQRDQILERIITSQRR